MNTFNENELRLVHQLAASLKANIAAGSGFSLVLPPLDAMALQKELARHASLVGGLDFWIVPETRQTDGEPTDRRRLVNAKSLETLGLTQLRASQLMADMNPKPEEIRNIPAVKNVSPKTKRMRDQFRDIQAGLLSGAQPSYTLYFNSKIEAIRAVNNWHSWPEKDFSIATRRSADHALEFFLSFKE